MAKTNAPAETISTLDDVEPDAPQATTVSNAVLPKVTGSHHGFSGVKARVIINESEGDAGREAVYVALNDYAAQIPRNIEVELPVEVFNACIRDAKTTVLSRTGDGLASRDVRRFSYSMLGEVAAAA